MMSFVVIGSFLDAPEPGDARFIEWYVIAAAFAAQCWLGKSHTLGEWIERAVDRFACVVIGHQADGQHFSRTAVVDEDAGDLLQFLLVRLHVSPRAVQALFFTRKQHEADRSHRLHAKLLQGARGGQNRG